MVILIHAHRLGADQVPPSKQGLEAEPVLCLFEP